MTPDDVSSAEENPRETDAVYWPWVGWVEVAVLAANALMIGMLIAGALGFGYELLGGVSPVPAPDMLAVLGLWFLPLSLIGGAQVLHIHYRKHPEKVRPGLRKENGGSDDV